MNSFITNCLVNPHSHLREDDDVRRALIWHAYAAGVRVLGPMPNTNPELISGDLVTRYVNSCRLLVPDGMNMGFIPIGYLSETTTHDDIDRFLENGVRSLKVYPFDRTTNSKNGVRDYYKLLPIIDYCGRHGMCVHFHPENPWMTFENRDAEFAFLPIVDMFLRATNVTIVWEHGTDARCIPFWKEMAKTGRFFVTLTAHHLATHESACYGDRGAVCKPPFKTLSDMYGLRGLVMEDHSWVMAGADDAPHDISKKNVPAGKKCACGAFTTPFLAQLYAHALDVMLGMPGGPEIFERFISTNAQVFHRLAPVTERIQLVREEYVIPGISQVGSWTVENFWGDQKLLWSLK